MTLDSKITTRVGGLRKISKMLQEGGHFIRMGSDKSKLLQEGVSSNTDGRVL